MAIERVKRNMYVDDLMKSAKETSEAIGLVSQLRHLLEKGGFVSQNGTVIAER